MITIPQAVEQIVRNHPFVEEGLRKDIINLSSYARMILPDVKRVVRKPVKEGAIVMGLRRLRERIPVGSSTHSPTKLVIGPITMRSNLVEFTFGNSDSLVECHARLLEDIVEMRNVFFTITQGVHQTTLIVSTELRSLVVSAFKDEKCLSTISDLAALSLQLPINAVEIPGLHYMILKQLAWEGVNVIEEVSTYTEFTIIIKDEDIHEALGTLRSMLKARQF